MEEDVDRSLFNSNFIKIPKNLPETRRKSQIMGGSFKIKQDQLSIGQEDLGIRRTHTKMKRLDTHSTITEEEKDSSFDLSRR